MTEWPPEDGATLVDGMPEEDYHAHPALSASGMKQILRSPKHYLQSRSQPVERPAFDVGRAAHALMLGVGAPIVEIPSDMLASNGAISTARAKEFVANAKAEGKLPLKEDTYARVRGMADAVLTHPKAGPILERPRYTEVSLFALDTETGVPLRGRLDVLSGSLIADPKTTTDVREHKVRQAIQDFGYDISGEVYRYLVRQVTGVDPEPVQLIFVEKEAPFEVRVVELGEGFQATGQIRMRKAIEVFQSCIEFSVWPGADDEPGEVSTIEPAGWFVAEAERLAGVSI